MYVSEALRPMSDEELEFHRLRACAECDGD
jgi:hypothetical protein